MHEPPPNSELSRRELAAGASAALVFAAGTVSALVRATDTTTATTAPVTGTTTTTLAPPSSTGTESTSPAPASAAPAAATTTATAPTAATGGRAALDASAVARHVARRLTFGPTPALLGDIERVGFDEWFGQQLQPATIDDSDLDGRLAAIDMPLLDVGAITRLLSDTSDSLGIGALVDETLSATSDATMTLRQLLASLPPFQQQALADGIANLRTANLLRAVYSRRQVLEQMVDFWANHLNVWADQSSLMLAATPLYDRDILRPHALGRFTDLLIASAGSLAMLVFLDNWTNRAGSPNENFGRELLELHTLGRQAGFTESDVHDSTRTFTGWTLDLQSGQPVFDPQAHDAGPKRVFGWSTPGLAGAAGRDEGVSLLDYLAHHPATAMHLATKLVTRFVSDDPPPGVVASVAQAYLANDTAIGPALAAIVASDEFWDSNRQKVRRPFDHVAAALRGTAAEIDASNAGPVLDASLLKLGQRLYGQPSPAGYAEPAAGWLGVGLLGRWQFGQQLAMARLPGVSVDPAQLAPNAATASAFVDGLLGALYGPDVDPDRRTALLTLVGDPQAPFDPASGAARQVLAYALAAQEASVR